MNRITGTSIGSFILGAVLLLLPAFVGAAVVPVSVHCTASTTIASKLTAAAASPSRTLFVTGVCVENVTVRNQRVIIDGTGGATLKPLDPTKAAITFRGGTTEATIQGMTIETGANPTDPSAPTPGTSCNADGNTLKGGDGIDVRDGANVSIGLAAAFDVPAHNGTGGAIIPATPDVVAIGNTINVRGAGRGIRVRNGANATLSANTINGNKLTPDGLTLGTAACGGALNKSFAGSTGIDVSSAAIAALGTLVNQTADTVVGGTSIDNRNTVSGHDKGLACAQGTVTGLKAPTSNPAGSAGATLFSSNTTPGVPLTVPTAITQAGYNKDCFTDE
jgi:hypothetical protein